MAKNKSTPREPKRFELEHDEYLRIRKRGSYHYAYARHTEWGGQKERYLGRCDPDGTPYVHPRWSGERREYTLKRRVN